MCSEGRKVNRPFVCRVHTFLSFPQNECMYKNNIHKHYLHILNILYTYILKLSMYKALLYKKLIWNIKIVRIFVELKNLIKMMNFLFGTIHALLTLIALHNSFPLMLTVCSWISLQLFYRILHLCVHRILAFHWPRFWICCFDWEYL